MSLRYRLFLWVALVFSVAFAASFYMETHLTKRNLEKTYQELMKKLDELNQEKIEGMQAYLADMLYKIQAEVDSVLQGVSKYQLVRSGFEPSLETLKNYSWLDSASLMITNRWIDFIQNTNEDVLMSEIIVDRNPLEDTLHFPIHDFFHLIAIHEKGDLKKWRDPLIGINLEISTLHGGNKGEKESDEDYYVFFTPDAILNFQENINLGETLSLSVNLLEPFLKWLEVAEEKFFLKEFVSQILTAQKLLKNDPTLIPTKERWDQMIEESLKTLSKETSVYKPCYSFFEDSIVSGKGTEDTYYQENVRYYVKEFIEHYNKVGLIWGLSTLIHSDLFGRNPISDKAPLGMGIVDLKKKCGKALYSKDVFFNEPQYLVKEAVDKMNKLPTDFLTTHLDVISPYGANHIFLGNTLRLESEGRKGYLTVGTHGWPVLASLARSTHQISLFITGNKVIQISTPEGEDMQNPAWNKISPEDLLSKPSGLITVDGKEYFFLHIVPYERVDLHFFIFNPKEKEFAFINSVNEGSREVIKELSFQMRFAAIGGLLFVLLFLNGIAKRITKPITYLAGVTKTVAEGKLDDIEIPDKPKKVKRDEIYTLYHSFFEMVKGLREKERMRGVLNKVVSEEIAEEALKGNIQLGGEETKVTVLFADIRDFSNITEKMDPKEVIQLVNGCMTKVSEKIDKYEGVIDKYVGDEVMALFGAPIKKEDSPLSAIKSALETVEELKAWNVERKKQGLPEIEMGIGIHTGNVVVGNMGAENRLNYTVLGANVNLAARICSEAKGMQVLISEATLSEEGVQNNIECEKLQPVELKGFTGDINVYSVKSLKGKTLP